MFTDGLFVARMQLPRSVLCRRTVRRWWNWLESSTLTFEFFLRSRFPEWGRATDWTSFWRVCLGSMPLSEIMACLDYDGVDVP